MHTMTVLTRTVHFAATLSLAGVFVFLAVVAEPVLARARLADATAFRRTLRRVAWASLAVALLSGTLWLVLEARSMSGRSLADVFSQDVIGVVLTRTRFGGVFEVRLALLLSLAAILATGDRLDGRPGGVLLRWGAVFLGGGFAAALAWAGHAAAAQGVEGEVNAASDVLHLVAASAWLGALVPLALLYARACSDGSRLDTARAATRRFSLLGIASVATLLATGIVNSWFLVGGIPGLLGTLYGRLLLVKLVLFAAMVGVAAVNRRRLTPQLNGIVAPAAALKRLRRNALIETALGLGILLVVGALGTEPPGAHLPPDWPLPFRIDLDAFPPSPALNQEAVLYAAGIAAGLAALLLAALRRRQRWVIAGIGLALLVAAGRTPLAWTLEDAYPTTFYHSTVPADAPDIVAGAAVYADQCAQCHGAGGHGDGPAGRDLPVKPADLTAPHLFAHREGDLYWWISQGRSNGAMPGFAGALSERQRWQVIAFIRARAAGVQPNILLPLVTAGPAPPAPDFVFEEAGSQESLHAASEREPVLLVFYRLPGSLPRLEALAAAERRLAHAGLRLLAVPADAEAASRRKAAPPLPDFAATTGPETAAAYALFEGSSDGLSEFLVDRAGLLRARWKADTAIGLAPPEELLAQLDRLARFPLARKPSHIHSH
jgi:putative copper export protein/mono/diheme cytochrome c family protein